MSTATIKNDTEGLQWSKEELLYGHDSRLIAKETEVRMWKGQLQSCAHDVIYSRKDSEPVSISIHQ